MRTIDLEGYTFTVQPLKYGEVQEHSKALRRLSSKSEALENVNKRLNKELLNDGDVDKTLERIDINEEARDKIEADIFKLMTSIVKKGINKIEKDEKEVGREVVEDLSIESITAISEIVMGAVTKKN